MHLLQLLTFCQGSGNFRKDSKFGADLKKKIGIVESNQSSHHELPVAENFGYLNQEFSQDQNGLLSAD